jgi:hypothetical protein
MDGNSVTTISKKKIRQENFNRKHDQKEHLQKVGNKELDGA